MESKWTCEHFRTHRAKLKLLFGISCQCRGCCTPQCTLFASRLLRLQLSYQFKSIVSHCVINFIWKFEFSHRSPSFFTQFSVVNVRKLGVKTVCNYMSTNIILNIQLWHLNYSLNKAIRVHNKWRQLNCGCVWRLVYMANKLPFERKSPTQPFR